MARSLRSLFLLVIGISTLVVGLYFLSARLSEYGPPPPLELAFEPTTFEALEGWSTDNLSEAIPAFLVSCQTLEKQVDSATFGGSSWITPEGLPIAGTVADWREVCAAAASLPHGHADAARAFFETWFIPVSVVGGSRPQGLFTGYYEPYLRGSRTQDNQYTVPLFARPDDLVEVSLGNFRDTLKGKRIAGRVNGGRLEPFESRAEIEAGGLEGMLMPLVFVDDVVDAFFLHIQGSGRIHMDDGSVLRMGYNGQNGHVYTAIGRFLIESGDVAREDMSMQAIRSWLEDHPKEGVELMAKNASFIFFRESVIEDAASGPLGAQGIGLTPERSLAVDRTLHAMGQPVWIETTLPPREAGAYAPPFQKLMIAQDTGGAITGPVRGDVFFGWGERAEDLAGRMKQQGRMTLLLPQPLAERLLPVEGSDATGAGE